MRKNNSYGSSKKGSEKQETPEKQETSENKIDVPEKFSKNNTPKDQKKKSNEDTQMISNETSEQESINAKSIFDDFQKIFTPEAFKKFSDLIEGALRFFEESPVEKNFKELWILYMGTLLQPKKNEKISYRELLIKDIIEAKEFLQKLLQKFKELLETTFRECTVPINNEKKKEEITLPEPTNSKIIEPILEEKKDKEIIPTKTVNSKSKIKNKGGKKKPKTVASETIDLISNEIITKDVPILKSVKIKEPSKKKDVPPKRDQKREPIKTKKYNENKKKFFFQKPDYSSCRVTRIQNLKLLKVITIKSKKKGTKRKQFHFKFSNGTNYFYLNEKDLLNVTSKPAMISLGFRW